MSNRNFDASTIIKILKVQNAANNQNRFQTLTNSSVNQLAPNPQAQNFDAEVVTEYAAGSQTYFFQGFPTMTYISPVLFPSIAPTPTPTPDTTGLPTVVSDSYSFIRAGTVISFTLSVTASGTSPITEIGTVFSASNPTPIIGQSGTVNYILESKTIPITALGTYQMSIPVITFFRAYATNSSGTSYGAVLTTL